MAISKTKQRLLDLVKQAHVEGLENIKLARKNARTAETAEIKPYGNKALIALTTAIGQL